MEQSVELFRQEDIEFRSICLILDEDGSLRVSGQDMGPEVEATWGDDDYEFWVTIPSDAVAMLAFRLLQDRFAGDMGAVTKVRDICKRYGIRHEFATWT